MLAVRPAETALSSSDSQVKFGARTCWKKSIPSEDESLYIIGLIIFWAARFLTSCKLSIVSSVSCWVNLIAIFPLLAFKMLPICAMSNRLHWKETIHVLEESYKPYASVIIVITLAMSAIDHARAMSNDRANEFCIVLIFSVLANRIIFQISSRASYCSWLITLLICSVVGFQHPKEFCIFIPLISLFSVMFLLNGDKLDRQHKVDLSYRVRTVTDKLELEHKNSIAQERAKQLRSLIGNIAHDMKTPLQGFTLAVSQLRESIYQIHQNTKSALSMHSNYRNLEGRICQQKVDLVNNSISKAKVDDSDSCLSDPSVSACTSSAKVGVLPCVEEVGIQNSSECEISNSNGNSQYQVTSNSINSKNSVENIANTLSYLNEAFTSITELNDSLVASTAFMSMIINRSIEFTKVLHHMKLVPTLTSLSFEESISFPVQCMRISQERIDVTLEPIPSNIAHFLVTDHDWLKENILCLLSNAVKYSQQGPVVMRTALVHDAFDSNSFFTQSSNDWTTSPKRRKKKSISKGDMIRIEVENYGENIGPEQKAKIFLPFAEHEHERISGGIGMGLFILSARIKALGGQYGVEDRSDDQSGSLFWFTIPADSTTNKQAVSCEASNNISEMSFSGITSMLSLPSVFYPHRLMLSPDDDETATMAMSTKPSSTNDLDAKNVNGSHSISFNVDVMKGLKVLVVEDSPIVLKLIVRSMKPLCAQVDQAVDGKDALAVLRERGPFDVILTDLQMPNMNGVDLTRAIRAQEDIENGSERQIIIGMSANGDETTHLTALGAGMNSFIAKPINIASLAFVICQVSKR